MAQPGAAVISAPKTNAKVVSPTSMTNDETCLKLREKNILNMIPIGRIDRRGLLPVRLFLRLIDGKQIINGS